MKRCRAEVVFTERVRSTLGWNVRLVNPGAVRDEQRQGKPVMEYGKLGFRARIDYNGPEEDYGLPTPPDRPPRYGYITQGLHRGGRRYGVARTVTEAQQRIADWARRRFYYEEES